MQSKMLGCPFLLIWFPLLNTLCPVACFQCPSHPEATSLAQSADCNRISGFVYWEKNKTPCCGLQLCRQNPLPTQDMQKYSDTFAMPHAMSQSLDRDSCQPESFAVSCVAAKGFGSKMTVLKGEEEECYMCCQPSNSFSACARGDLLGL